MFKVELTQKGDYAQTFTIDRYNYYENHMELIFPNNSRIKVLPYENIYRLNIFPIPAEQGAEG